MKKPIVILAGALTLSSAVLFASCGEVTTSFSSSWFSNTTLTSSISDTHETLTYAVTFEKGNNKNVDVNYANGVYSTDLINGIYTWENGETDNVYVYTTTLSLDVTYTVAGESETYHDEIQTKATFRTSDNGLKPVSSFRSVKAHSLNDSAPVSLKDNIVAYDYTLQTTYDKEVTQGILVYTDTASKEQKVTQFKIADDYSYLDNEELLFAIRGMAMGSDKSETVLVMNTARTSVQAIKISNQAVATLTPSFTVNGKAVSGTLTYNQVSVEVNDTRSGVGQTCYYAATNDSAANTYRNVMIVNRTVLPYNLGTAVYTLTDACFATK